MSLDLAFNVALSLLLALGGLWLKSVSEELRRLQLMTGMMQDVKDSIQRIDNKLDRKADK
ncbi:MAG: hypothetical protein ACR5LG_01640 [Sodalis sp. (in: enterobacteria)]|uniref:hypothetical protein n=1 Tax=Sodalis sp. (in: enterobacteria) TaxID=1898979 RepID=UPI003F3D7689